MAWERASRLEGSSKGRARTHSRSLLLQQLLLLLLLLLLIWLK
jgi:hypothetical protein